MGKKNRTKQISPELLSKIIRRKKYRQSVCKAFYSGKFTVAEVASRHNCSQAEVLRLVEEAKKAFEKWERCNQRGKK